MPHDANSPRERQQPVVARLAQQLGEHVHYWEELGEREVLVLRQAQPPVRMEPTLVSAGERSSPGPPPALCPVAEARSLFTEPELLKAQTLAEVRQVLGDCRRCKLCAYRTQVVFGVGNPQAELMFVGEGPGRDEDLQGEPFVGRAGQLLTEIITKGMKMKREEVYIANVVKCRPPDNRNPEPDEIAQCLPFLERQIDLVAPKVIVALGKVAAQALLKTTTPISRLRGQWYSYRGIPLMPTLHPAYLLRNPADKRLVWEDIKQVMRKLESNP